MMTYADWPCSDCLGARFKKHWFTRRFGGADRQKTHCIHCGLPRNPKTVSKAELMDAVSYLTNIPDDRLSSKRLPNEATKRRLAHQTLDRLKTTARDKCARCGDERWEHVPRVDRHGVYKWCRVCSRRCAFHKTWTRGL